MKKSRVPDVSDSTVHLLHRAGQCAEETFERCCAHLGLTARQFIVLAVVASTDDPSQTVICEKSGIDRSTLADIVRRLVSRGLLTRRRTRRDARMYAVRLSESGRQTLASAMPAAQAAEEELLRNLAPAQRAELETALRRIVETVVHSAAA